MISVGLRHAWMRSGPTSAETADVLVTRSQPQESRYPASAGRPEGMETTVLVLIEHGTRRTHLGGFTATPPASGTVTVPGLQGHHYPR